MGRCGRPILGKGADGLALACILSRTGTRALGRQWRIDAGLSADHELVTRGPHRVVRHPIYTSMLFAIGAVCFVAGTEIRVHIEEAAGGALRGAVHGVSAASAGVRSVCEVNFSVPDIDVATLVHKLQLAAATGDFAGDRFISGLAGDSDGRSRGDPPE